MRGCPAARHSPASPGSRDTAFGTLSTAQHRWLVVGFPLFGIAVAAISGVSTLAALGATESIRKQDHAAGLDRLGALTPGSRTGHRGQRAAETLPLVFGTVWLLALAGLYEN